MFNRCKHEWEVLNSRFNPGIFDKSSQLTEFKGFLNDELQYGYTEFSMRCKICGQPKVDRIVGRWSDE